MIPKKIFQTYKTSYEDLPIKLKELSRSWQDKNPDYEYHYYSDSDIEKFILKYYGSEWHTRYLKMPFPVMKADVFRVLVMNIFGGFYADMDSECREPLDNLNGDGVKSVISAHSYFEFTHWFFGFSKNHPINQKLVDSLAYNLDNFVFDDFSDPLFRLYQKKTADGTPNWDKNQMVRYITQITGPLWWAEQVDKHFQLERVSDYSMIPKGQIRPSISKRLKEQGCVWLDRSDTDETDQGPVRHIFGSINPFGSKGYESWVDYKKKES